MRLIHAATWVTLAGSVFAQAPPATQNTNAPAAATSPAGSGGLRRGPQVPKGPAPKLAEHAFLVASQAAEPGGTSSE